MLPGDDGGGATGEAVPARRGRTARRVVVHHVDVVAVGGGRLPLDRDHPRSGEDCEAETDTMDRRRLHDSALHDASGFTE